MGEIVATKRARQGGKILVEVLVNQDEFRQLRGEMSQVYLFSEKVANVPSKVSLRGRNEVTKYFLIPRQLRKRLAIRGEVSCQRIERDGKSVFIYVLDPYKQHSADRLSL
jgi:hypothetical protein